MLAAICEDDPICIEQLRKYCELWADQHPQAGLVMKQYKSPEDLLDAWENGAVFDVFFLDIEFDYMSGYELAETIRKKDSNTVLVFVTNSRNYVYDGYTLSVYRYLLKPVKDEDVAECLNYVYEQNMAFSEEILTFEVSGGGIRIRLKDIVRIECQLHKIQILTSDGNETTVRIYQSFTTFVKKLPEKWFVQCSRSSVINMIYVRQYTKSEIYLTAKKQPVSIGRKYSKETVSRLENFFWRTRA